MVETSQESKNLADKLSLARASGAWSAWAEMLRRFDRKQRQHLANLLAHNWSIKSLVLESQQGSPEEISGSVELNKTQFPIRGKEDPALRGLSEKDKAVSALMAENFRLKAEATSAKTSYDVLSQNIENLLTELHASLETSEPCERIKNVLAQFKDNNYY